MILSSSVVLSMRSSCLYLAVLLTSIGGLPLAAVEKAAPSLQDLVAQLDSDSYAQREAAAAKLTELGDEALPVLQAALKSPDAETRLRVVRILAEIQQNDLQRRIDAFLVSTDPEAGSDLPGWPRFRELVGDGRDQRQWYVGMLKAEGDLLYATENNPRAAAGTFQLRCQQLQAESSSQGRELDTPALSAVMFVAADERVPMTPGTDSLLYRFCSHSAIEKELTEPDEDSIMRKIIGGWIASGRGGYYSLRLAMQHDLPEGLAAAEKMLTGDTPAYYRQYGILTFAKLGDKSHIPRLAQLLGDKTVCTTHRVNDDTYQTQFRDIALVAVLHLAGYDPQMFGFERIRPHSEYVYSPYTLGFKDDEEREAAFAKWETIKPKVTPDPPGD